MDILSVLNGAHGLLWFYPFTIPLNEKMKSKPFDGEHYCKTIHNMTEATQDIYLETTHVFHLMCQLHI